MIALCDRGGANGTARVITQIVYDAHGAVIDRDDPYGAAASAGKELRVGHKGLFFDRLDAGISDPMTGQETPRLWPGARLSGYARNRTLHCDFGRWNQQDPNMTGLPIQAAMVYHGNGLRTAVQGFDLREHFGDGANVYAYLGGAPWTHYDPLGTESLLSILGNMAQRAVAWSRSTAGVAALKRAGVRALSYGVVNGAIGAAGGFVNNPDNPGRGAVAGFVGGFLSGAIAGGIGGGMSAGMGHILASGAIGGGIGAGAEGIINGDRGQDILWDVGKGAVGGAIGAGIGAKIGGPGRGDVYSVLGIPAGYSFLDLFYGVYFGNWNYRAYGGSNILGRP